METLKVEASYRSDMSKSHMKQLRREGFVTGSVFGHDSEPVPIELKLDDFAKQAKHAAAGIKSLIDLKIKGGPKKTDGMVILKEFYKDPLTRKVLDVQFQRINLNEKVSVNVPIVLIGEAIGIKEGGTVEQPLDELHVSCLPTDIPPHIDVEVGHLAIGQHVRAGEIEVGENVEVLTDPDAVVCTCAAPHVHKPSAAEEAAAEAAEAAAEAGEVAPEAEPKAEESE
jgi:large subunit ribosomal protein L25